MTFMKVIWIINQYGSTPSSGMGGRSFYFAKELSSQGYKVYLISASYTHLLRRPPSMHSDFKTEKVDGFDFVWVKVPEYSNAHARKRVYNWFAFSWKIRKLFKFIKCKPDVIIYSSPSLIPYLGAYWLSWSLGVRLIWDVRDLWPLTLIELSKVKKYHPFIFLNQLIENFACKNSSFIISNWPYAINYMRLHGADESRFLFLPNGFDAEEFNNFKKINHSIKTLIPLNNFIVGYVGTLGKANAMLVLLDVALSLKNTPNLKFVIVGEGGEKSKMKDFIVKNKLSNIILIDQIPKNQVPSMLDCFDVCYVGFNKSKLYNFGSSLNKLPEYMMSGKPIIYSIDSPFKPVIAANCGMHVPAEDSESIEKSILKLKLMRICERKELGENGRQYALENYNYKNLSKKLSDVIERVSTN
jgi:glycosyltransferase involved in cell wall biosynthesis